MTAHSRKRALSAALLAALLVQAVPAPAADSPVLRVGSKRFTESYILGELLVQAAARLGPAEHRVGLGNTGILYAALRAGSIDDYP